MSPKKGHSSSKHGKAKKAFSVAVQPPSNATLNALLYPPLVVESRNVHFANMTATAVLVDQSGTVRQDGLGGNPIASGTSMEQAAGCSSSSCNTDSLYFVFDTLTVVLSGTFALRVDLYDCGEGDMTMVGQVTTQPFTVFQNTVAVERPSPRETEVLDLLAANGFSIPQPQQ